MAVSLTTRATEILDEINEPGPALYLHHAIRMMREIGDLPADSPDASRVPVPLMQFALAVLERHGPPEAIDQLRKAIDTAANTAS